MRIILESLTPQMLLLVASVATLLGAALSPPHRELRHCATSSPEDSAVAQRYQRGVERVMHMDSPRATARWMPADSARCVQFSAIAQRDSLASDEDRLFLYELIG